MQNSGHLCLCQQPRAAHALRTTNFIRAANGFISKIEYHEDLKTFSWPKCGTAPSYIVADGKSDGPTKRKVQHLKEFGQEEDDVDCLPSPIRFVYSFSFDQ